MRRNLSKKRKITATFMVMLFTATFMISFLPAVAVAQVTIYIEPGTGNVGTPISVNGIIETPNGTYTIFFDGELMKSGNATNNEVTDTFTVPNRPAGDYYVILQDVETNKNSTAAVFALKTAYHIKAVVPPSPKQLQEFSSTTIWVNVTGGKANTVYVANITVKEPSPANSTYWKTAPLTNTTTTGYGQGSVMYPANFAGAHTNYTGVYTMFFNKTQTRATGNFTVGLTNATEYHRFQVVDIKAANYTKTNEYAWVNVTFAGKTVFSKNVPAVSGMINANWTIPGNASMGLYNVTVTSSTGGTVKPVLDIQNFTIVKIPCQIQTKKLNGEILADVWVDVYNETNDWIDSNMTDEEGLASVSVEGGNYTFNASLAINPEVYAPVGTLVNQSIKESVNITLWCWVAYLNITISPPLPLINITLTYQDVTDSFETNSTGILEISKNFPTNISYTIVAQRYGYPFNTTSMEKLPGAAMNVSWVNLTITVPNYTLFVQALDSKESPIKNVKVAVYEWSSGITNPVKSNTTNDRGNATFHTLLFGKYKIRVYNQAIVLNETVLNLIENQTFLVIHCKIFKVDLTVVVKDYFGNPISDALVKVERENVNIPSQKTGSNGKTLFENITGGKVRLSVSVNGKLCETRTIYLDETTGLVEFKLDRYVMVAGYPLEITQFIACISLGMLIALFALALIYRRFRTRKVSEGKEKSL